MTIAQGGVLPNIQAVLLPKKSQGAGCKSDECHIQTMHFNTNVQ